jgi:two-component system cell cycle response regulator
MGARILVVEDNAANLHLMTYLLKAFGHETSVAMDGEEAIQSVAREAPELIVCDIQLPRLDGYGVARHLKSNAAWRPIPLVAVTAFAMVGDRDRILASGFDGYIPKPIVPQTFVQQVEGFLPPESRSSSRVPARDRSSAPPSPGPETPRATIVVIDNSRPNLDLARHTLSPAGYRVVTAQSVDEGLASATRSRPDLILCDLHMPEKTGFDLLREIKADAHLAGIPVIIISSTYSGEIDEETTRSCGADRFVMRPLAPEALVREIEETLAARKVGA